jgi:hypothetical protein
MTIYDYLKVPIKDGNQYGKAVDVFQRKIRSGFRPVFVGSFTSIPQEDLIKGKMKSIDNPKIIKEIDIKIIPTDLSNKYLSEVELKNQIVSKEHLMIMFLWVINPQSIGKKVTK